MCSAFDVERSSNPRCRTHANLEKSSGPNSHRGDAPGAVKQSLAALFKAQLVWQVLYSVTLSCVPANEVVKPAVAECQSRVRGDIRFSQSQTMSEMRCNIHSDSSPTCVVSGMAQAFKFLSTRPKYADSNIQQTTDSHNPLV